MNTADTLVLLPDEQDVRIKASDRRRSPQESETSGAAQSSLSFVALCLTWQSTVGESLDWDAVSDSGSFYADDASKSEGDTSSEEKDTFDFSDPPLSSTSSSSAMTTAWSSASTGKPQLSYAERLRMAKSGPSRKPEAETSENTDNASEQSVSNSGIPSTKEPFATTQEAEGHAEKVVLERSEASTRGGDSPSLAQSTSGGGSAQPSKQSTNVLPKANVWEERKKQLQDRARQQTVDTVSNDQTSAAQGDQRAAATRGTDLGIARASEGRSRSSMPKEKTQTANEWKNRAAIITASTGDQSSPASHSSADKTRGQTPSESAPSTNVQSEKGEKFNKTARKKKQSSLDGSASEEKGALPSFSDAADWPSPTVVKSGRSTRPLASSESRSGEQSEVLATGPAASEDDSAKKESDHAKQRDDVRTASTSSSAAIDSLNVELLRMPGAEKQRKGGKQWISIVPTITHATPPSRQQQQQQQQAKKGKPASYIPTLRPPKVQESALTKDGRRTSSNPESRNPTSRLSREGRVSKQDEHLQSDFLSGEGDLDKHKARANTNDGATKELREAVNGVSAGQLTPSEVMPASTQSTPGSSSPLQIGDLTTNGSATPRNGSRTPRGVRGRGGSKRAEETDQTDGNALVANASSLNDASLSDARTSAHKLPFNAPRGPRAGSVSRHRPSEPQPGYGTQFAIPFQGAPFGPPTFVPQQFGGPHAHPPFDGGSAFTPYGGMPFVESTPPELAPNGVSSTTEPTAALLFQIEFYFSHQNLQGDFFLRKNMDAEGFVPVDIVASFNRVKRLAGNDNVELIKETVGFSKALQFNEEKSKIRKAFGWEPYVLLGGEHAQFVVAPPMPPPPPFHVNAAYLPSVVNGATAGHPAFVPHRQRGFSTPNSPPMPPPPQTLTRMSFTATSGNHPSVYGGTPLPSLTNNVHYQQSSVNHEQSVTLPFGSRSERSPSTSDRQSTHPTQDQNEDETGKENDDDDDDDDDDEASLGVVAATGLGGTLNTGQA